MSCHIIGRYDHCHLTCHHDEGRGKPVPAEHLALRTDEGQVEPDWGRRRQVWPGSGRLGLVVTHSG